MPAPRLLTLARRARACRRCDAVAAGSAVLSVRNGAVPAHVVFVAEAPGYLGGVRTGIPLSGDQSGRNFRAYCRGAGLDLSRAFITNAVLCHPPSAKGRNRRPSRAEVQMCSAFLARQLALADPILIVTLGRVALDAVGLLEPHALRFGLDVASPAVWNDRHLASLFHPSGQTQGRRSRAQQAADYRRLARWLQRRANSGGIA